MRLIIFLFICLVGCGRPGLSEADVLDRLSKRGMTVERQQGIALSQGQLSRLPTSEQMFTIRVSNSNGTSGPITLLRFKNVSKAKKADQANIINGFAAQNWFFAGLVPVDIEDSIKEALK
ncbi:MAG: hypothetical protein KCHDKBKB_02521 [Elusimicrobia bacterium]|nr:hypothetical protein [Elusimicrobiota bacterium]